MTEQTKTLLFGLRRLLLMAVKMIEDALNLPKEKRRVLVEDPENTNF